MSEQDILVRYDGPAFTEHRMDVEDLAPALLALAELCKDVNRKHNGDRAAVNLLIDVDVEQQCFQFKFQIVQKIFDAAKSLIEDQEIVTAKEILEWVGLIKTPVFGLLGLLKVLKGRQPDSTQLIVRDSQNVTQLNVEGDVYIAHPQAVEMLKEQRAIKNSAAIIAPVLREGCDFVEFQHGSETAESISSEDAKAISEMKIMEIEASSVIPKSTIRAKVKIRKAVYEGTGKWTIQYDRSREVSMMDEAWLKGFQGRVEKAPPGSWLDVTMELSEIPLDENDNPIKEPEYSIIEVHDVDEPAEQQELIPVSTESDSFRGFPNH